MSPSKLIVTVILSSILVLGCKPKNPNLYGVVKPETPPVAKKYTGQTSFEGQKPAQQPIPEGTKVVPRPPPPPEPEPARYTQVDSEIFKPKVDILFMMDPSDSMKDDQKKLRDNFAVFSRNFLSKKDFLNFHVGVVTAWDSISFGNQQKDCEMGQLRPLGGMRGPFKGSCQAAKSEIPYVTNETAANQDQLNTILSSTISFGVEPFLRDSKTKLVMPNSGPQHEEVFSPVLAALKAENQTMNKNFRRSDAHLAVVFFSDTDDFDFINIEADAKSQDATNKKGLEDAAKLLDVATRRSLETSPEMIANQLKAQVKENVSVSVYAALGRYNDWMQTEGKTVGVYKNADFYIQQPGRGPRKLVELLDLMDGTGFDLRDANYGEKLSQIGNDIVKKSLRRVIVLDHAPEINPQRPIIVKYGKDQIIPKNDQTGWRYNVDEDKVHRITISENINIRPESGAKFSVEYTPVINKTKVQ